MRIRSIRPEFWSSEDVAEMDWHTRLVYIGLWSYVDDNGVGRDKERLIVAALFPLDEDLPESSRRVTGALQHLSSGGQITRYVVDGKHYLHVTAWTKHQRIEKASQGRYPLPTCENAEIAEPSPTVPVALPEPSTPGEGEKGRRGEGEKSSSADKSAQTLERFEEFWDTYGKKIKRADAERKWAKAIKKASPDRIIAAAAAYVAHQRANNEGGRYIADPSTWLHGERWADEDAVHALSARPTTPHVSAIEQPPDGLSPQEFDEWDRARRRRQAANR